MADALTEILFAACSLKDKRQLAAIVAPLGGDEFATKLRNASRQEIWHFYDTARGEAIYVASDGAWVCRGTVTHVSHEGATLILAECRILGAWSESRFRTAVVKALDATVHRLQ